ATKIGQCKMPQRVILNSRKGKCCIYAASNRQRSGRHDLFQYEKSANLAYAGQLDDLARMQLVESFQVADAQHQEVVEFACHQVAFQAAADALGRFLEVGERVGCGTIQHHAHDD